VLTVSNAAVESRGTASAFVVSRIGLVLATLVALLNPLARDVATASDQAVFRGAPASPSKRSDLTATLRAYPVGALAQRLAFDEATSAGERVRAYDIDMTKRMHLIIVDAALKTFLHVHAALDRFGTFHQTVAVPHPGLYHIYADTEPHGWGHQVFRFDVPFGNAAAPRNYSSSLRIIMNADVGPYRVTLNRVRLVAGITNVVEVSITSGGRPATDIHPYLGGMAHAVFINADNLAYVHVHPMPAVVMTQMTGMRAMDTDASMSRRDDTMEMHDMAPTATVAPHMVLRVPRAAPGPYVLWLQFRGGTRLYVARFDMTASRVRLHQGIGVPS
jgi:hypothetical protein